MILWVDGMFIRTDIVSTGKVTNSDTTDKGETVYDTICCFS